MRGRHLRGRCTSHPSPLPTPLPFLPLSTVAVKSEYALAVQSEGVAGAQLRQQGGGVPGPHGARADPPLHEAAEEGGRGEAVDVQGCPKELVSLSIKIIIFADEDCDEQQQHQQPQAARVQQLGQAAGGGGVCLTELPAVKPEPDEK